MVLKSQHSYLATKIHCSLGDFQCRTHILENRDILIYQRGQRCILPSTLSGHAHQHFKEGMERLCSLLRDANDRIMTRRSPCTESRARNEGLRLRGGRSLARLGCMMAAAWLWEICM